MKHAAWIEFDGYVGYVDASLPEKHEVPKDGKEWQELEVKIPYTEDKTTSTKLWKYIAKIYNYEINKVDYMTDFLIIYNFPRGNLQRWRLKDAWITSLDFGDLDYSTGPPELLCNLKITFNDAIKINDQAT